MAGPFETAIEQTTSAAGAALAGPWRTPRQMLAAQSYDSHASIHDDATAQKLGFKGGTIEGPTHFSTQAPCVRGRAALRAHAAAPGLAQARPRRRPRR